MWAKEWYNLVYFSQRSFWLVCQETALKHHLGGDCNSPGERWWWPGPTWECWKWGQEEGPRLSFGSWADRNGSWFGSSTVCNIRMLHWRNVGVLFGSESGIYWMVQTENIPITKIFTRETMQIWLCTSRSVGVGIWVDRHFSDPTLPLRQRKKILAHLGRKTCNIKPCRSPQRLPSWLTMNQYDALFELHSFILILIR